MSCQLALLSIGMVCYRQSICGGATKHMNSGILQRGTPDMDGVPGVTYIASTLLAVTPKTLTRLQTTVA